MNNEFKKYDIRNQELETVVAVLYLPRKLIQTLRRENSTNKTSIEQNVTLSI